MLLLLHQFPGTVILVISWRMLSHVYCSLSSLHSEEVGAAQRPRRLHLWGQRLPQSQPVRVGDRRRAAGEADTPWMFSFSPITSWRFFLMDYSTPFYQTSTLKVEKREANDDLDDIESNLLLPAGVSLRWATLSLKVFRAEDVPQSKNKHKDVLISVKCRSFCCKWAETSSFSFMAL